MTAAEKINFVNEHQSAEFFEKDAELYRKIFPDSRLLPELSRANQYNKNHLDGRMLLEILDVVCGETVMENRGIVVDPAKGGEDEQILINTFKKADLDKATYQDTKKWVKDLGLQVADQKGQTLLAALKAKQEELNSLPEVVAAVDGQTGPEVEPKAEEATDVKPEGSTEVTPAAPAGDEGSEKKSGDPE